MRVSRVTTQTQSQYTMDKSASILIVGGSGTFGLSTAWHLARAGYTNIQCIDRWPAPSLSSAGYDRNKIVRTEYSSPVYTKLAHEALELWKDPLFKDVFHQTGWIFATDGTEELGRKSNFYRCVENTRNHGDPSAMVFLPDWDAAVAKCPVLGTDARHGERKQNFRGIYNANAGWVDSTRAMAVIFAECLRLGVKFAAGPAGTAVELLRAPDGKTVVGALAEDGTEWLADKTILATGAYSDTLLDFKGQLQACAYVVTHLRMTEDQYQRYKDNPVLNISRLGYCFPPNEDRIFKICSTDTTYINTVCPDQPGCTWGPVSVPRDGAYHPFDTQPLQGHNLTMDFLEYLLPELRGAEIVSSRMCWDMECHDYSWLIGPHPESPKTFFLATGGSGHSFKNIVHVGKFVMQAMEGTLDPRYRDMWRWRPDRIGKDLESAERFMRPKYELRDQVGWNHDKKRHAKL